MRIGKIASKQAFNEDRVFSGLDITAQYLDDKNRISVMSFRYALLTDNLQGIVEKTLHAFLENKKMPKNVSLFVNSPGLR